MNPAVLITSSVDVADVKETREPASFTLPWTMTSCAFSAVATEALMTRLGLLMTCLLENSLISRSIESAQRKVEGHHFDTRKHLVQYDDVINTHRDIIYKTS